MQCLLSTPWVIQSYGDNPGLYILLTCNLAQYCQVACIPALLAHAAKNAGIREELPDPAQTSVTRMPPMAQVAYSAMSRPRGSNRKQGSQPVAHLLARLAKRDCPGRIPEASVQPGLGRRVRKASDRSKAPAHPEPQIRPNRTLCLCSCVCVCESRGRIFGGDVGMP